MRVVRVGGGYTRARGSAFLCAHAGSCSSSAERGGGAGGEGEREQEQEEVRGDRLGNGIIGNGVGGDFSSLATAAADDDDDDPAPPPPVPSLPNGERLAAQRGVAQGKAGEGGGNDKAPSPTKR